jgi:hypothetical protein
MKGPGPSRSPTRGLPGLGLSRHPGRQVRPARQAGSPWPRGHQARAGQSPRLQLRGRRRSHQRRRRDAPAGVETVGDMKVATSSGLRDAT